MPRRKRGNRQGQRLHLLALDHNKRPKEVVPSSEEGENGKGGESWFDQRKRHSPKDPQLRSSVDPGRIQIVVRNREHRLTEKEDSEGSGQARHDKARVSVEPSQVLQK